MWKLLQELIWPGVAASVIWAFFTVAIEQHGTSGVYVKLSMLFFVAVYLSFDWMNTQQLSNVDKRKPWFWIIDAAIAVMIVVFAVATQSNPHGDTEINEFATWARTSMAFAFVFAIFGHLFDAWGEAKSKEVEANKEIKESSEFIKKSSFKRCCFAAANMNGLIVIFGWLSTALALPISVALVVAGYIAVTIIL